MEYFFSLFFGTFILEDVALVTSLVFIAENKLSVTAAFWALFLGISLGDLGLYFIGKLASYLNFKNRIIKSKKIQFTLSKISHSDVMGYLVFISRFIPGTRLATYITAGLVDYSFFKFLTVTVVSVSSWVLVALLAGKTLHHFFMDHLIVSLFLFFIVLHLIKIMIPLSVDKWQRKAFMHSWRKWLTFEFWPSWFFYIPIVIWYALLSLRYRSLLNPFYANPNIINGGLLGESKWDFLKYLDSNDQSTLPSILVKKETPFEEWITLISENEISFPFILKPDVGQRGFGVRIIKDEFDLTEYLLLSDFDIILQKLADYKNEAGLFYIRYPENQNGFLFSITDKRFPYIITDGKNKIGDLILNDSRARIIATTYFDRLKNRLDEIPDANTKIMLSECGNHCQGAIFLNGNHYINQNLLNSVEKIVTRIPHFYFGRLDIRYTDIDSLQKGEFQIIEINGAGSEATHIWDANTKLLDAYKTLFIQWKTLFEIGHQVKKNKNIQKNVHLILFLKESFKVYFRKEKLSVSS